MNLLPAYLLLFAMFSPVFFWLFRELWRIHKAERCRPFGPLHRFYSPAFRVRVCACCGKREVLMRSWEFDGYDAQVVTQPN